MCLKLLLLAVTLPTFLGITWAAHTNLLSQLGSHMDVSCSDEKCDRNVNERLVRIMESFMRMEVDPCENFFQYACGNWSKIFDKFSSLFQQQEVKFNEIYVEIFENWQKQIEAGKGAELKLNAVYEKALNYYNSCVSERYIKIKKFPKNLEPAPQQKWPFFDNITSVPWNFENFVWWKVLAKLQSYGFSEVLLRAFVGTDTENSRKYSIVIDIPIPDKKVNVLLNGVFVTMGFHSNLLMKLLRHKLLHFEKQLAKVAEGEQKEPGHKDEEKLKEEEDHKEESENRSVNKDDDKLKGSSEEELKKVKSSSGESSNSAESTSSESLDYITLSELQSELPGIDWQEYFDILLQNETKKLPNDSIFFLSANDKPALQRVIKFLNESSKETIALYLLAYLIQSVERPLPVRTIPKNCVYFLRSLMPVAMDHIYEINYYGAIREESDAVIRNVFDRLKSKLSDLIEENNLDLTEKEIEFLLAKAKKMRLSIGNLPENITTDFLLEYYANVNITNATNFYHNHLELLHHKQLLQYRILNAYTENPKNIYESFDAVMGWEVSASPYILRHRNFIILPFAYLRMPLYHHKLHDVFQYAEIGFTTSHELMHGFDVSGLSFDADGNSNDIGQGIREKSGFVKKLECLSRERTASIDERIADVAGMRLVMETFFNEPTSKAKQFHTHSTSLTNRQLFFVKLSHFFCAEWDEKYGKETDLSEMSHDWSNIRVVYTMSNTREFAREFKCKENAALKLEEVCQLW